MKMCIIFFFILIIINYNLGDESNESKYIDLLPEEEKEQFLQKIARRIFEEAEVTDDAYKHSREVTEDQLNEHTEFVENILREESANLRKHSKDEKEREDKSDEDIRANPLVKDKISEERTGDDNRYLDLTQRQGRRKKRKDSDYVNLERNTESIINVDVKYDTVENKVVENGDKGSVLTAFQIGANSKELEDRKEQSSFEDIQVKHFNRKINFNNVNPDKTITNTSKPPFTQIMNFDVKSVEHFSKELSPAVNVQDKIKGSDSPFTTEKASENTETSSRRITESIYELITTNNYVSKHTTEKVLTTINRNASTDEDPVITNNADAQNINITQAVLRSDFHKNIMVANTSDQIYLSKDNEEAKNTTQIHELSTHKLYNIESNTSFNDNGVANGYSFDVEEHFKENIIHNTTPDITKVAESIDISNILVSKESEVSEKSTTNIYETKNIVVPIEIKNNFKDNQINAKIDDNKFGATVVKTTTKAAPIINEVAGDVVKALRQRLLQDDDNYSSDEALRNDKTKTAEDFKNGNRQTYNVYELPPNEKPFGIRNEIGKSKNQEQPYYVPIYNYSQNNAYFNAQNRYGPNLDASLEVRDSDTDFHGSEGVDDNLSLSKETYKMLRGNVDNRKFRFDSTENLQETHKVPKILMPVVNQQQHFHKDFINPDDYLDTDYYLGRTYTHFRDGRKRKSKTLTDSHEETQPSLDKLKDHIRSVRKILFQNQIFGYIPPVNGSVGEVTPPPNPVEVTRAPPYNYLKQTNGEKNIALNYYLGRMKLTDKPRNGKKDIKVGYIKFKNFIQDLHVTKYLPEELMRKVNIIKLGNNLFFRNNKKDLSLRNKTKIFSQDESPDHYDTIKKVLKLTNEVDLFTTLEKMGNMNISYTRSPYVSEDVTVYLEVLDHILKTDVKPLIQYDWLGSTVDIQSALSRLLDLTEAVQNKIVIHPADLGLLKYVVYLFQTAKTTLYLEMERDERNELRMGVILPRNRKRKPMFLKEKGLLNRVWLFKRENIIESEILNEFNKFLYAMQAALFDLHDAIKHIALITKYPDQAWFKNLQQIYMKNDKEHLLELLLHLTATRLFGLIEESAKKGVEMNTVNYIRNNDKHVDRSIGEFVFVLRLLDEIKRLEK